MMIFIDESGDSGFKQSSSSFFVLTMVIIKDDDIVKINKNIERLKKQYHIYPEYKFSRTSDFHKERFFNMLSPLPFLAHAIVVEKKLVYSSELRSNSKKFYNFFLKQLLQHSPLEKQAKIRIDKSSSKVFQKEAMAYIRQQLHDLNLNIKFLDSKSANLIQLADMISGAICRTFAHKEKTQWLPLIAKKVKNIWEFQ